MNFFVLILFVASFAGIMTRLPAIFTSEFSLMNQSVLFVIAHPDDETMFFGPSVLLTTQEIRNNSVNLLCLSNGNAEGIGHIRAEELLNSAELLGIPKSNVTIVNDAALPDSMQTTWDDAVVAKHIEAAVRETKATVIITYDDYGISGHTNHIQTFWGALTFVLSEYPHFVYKGEDIRNKDLPYDLSLYSLRSVSILRKYLFVLDAPIAWVMNLQSGFKGIFLNEFDYTVNVSAMTKAHKSQMKWYRWLWIGLSRYMIMNDIGPVNLEKAAPLWEKHHGIVGEAHQEL